MSERTDAAGTPAPAAASSTGQPAAAASAPSPFAKRSVPGTIGYWARRAWDLEVGVWKSLYRFVFRRPKVPAGATPITYHRSILTIMIVFIVLSAVEIPIIDLIVHPWPWVRIPLLGAGIWGLTWMTGYLFGFLTRPHAVGPDGIRVREGAEVEIVLPWSEVYSVARRAETAESRAPKFTPGRTPGTWVAHLRLNHETNLVIELERPVEVRMPQGRVLLDEVRCYADDPRAFLEAARPHL